MGIALNTLYVSSYITLIATVFPILILLPFLIEKIEKSWKQLFTSISIIFSTTIILYLIDTLLLLFYYDVKFNFDITVVILSGVLFLLLTSLGIYNYFKSVTFFSKKRILISIIIGFLIFSITISYTALSFSMAGNPTEYFTYIFTYIIISVFYALGILIPFGIYLCLAKIIYSFFTNTKWFKNIQIIGLIALLIFLLRTYFTIFNL